LKARLLSVGKPARLQIFPAASVHAGKGEMGVRKATVLAAHHPSVKFQRAEKI
jgi:hypothetical protein